MPKALFHPADSENALPQFVVIEGPQVGRTYEVSDGDKIGTHSESIILLPERRSQELQAQIAQLHGLFHIRNLSSTIPLLVNGEILEESPLHHGDMVVMGDLMLLFNEDHDPSRNQLQDFISSVELEENSISSRRKSFESSNSLLDTFVGLDREADRLKTLTRISHVINSIVKLDDLLEQILSVLFELLPADRGYIYLREEESRRLRPMATRSRDGLSSRSTGQISRTLIREVQRTRESVLTEDAMDDERFLSGESIVDQQIRSALCVPLLHDQDFVGVICLDTAYASQAFSEADHKLLNMVAYQAAGAILNVQLYEHRRQHVQNIHKVATAITRIARHLSARNILQEAVQQLHIVFGVDRCSIMMSSVVQELGSAGLDQLVVQGSCRTKIATLSDEKGRGRMTGSSNSVGRGIGRQLVYPERELCDLVAELRQAGLESCEPRRQFQQIRLTHVRRRFPRIGVPKWSAGVPGLNSFSVSCATGPLERSGDWAALAIERELARHKGATVQAMQ